MSANSMYWMFIHIKRQCRVENVVVVETLEPNADFGMASHIHPSPYATTIQEGVAMVDAMVEWARGRSVHNTQPGADYDTVKFQTTYGFQILTNWAALKTSYVDANGVAHTEVVYERQIFE